MLYISRVVSSGRFGVVDTDDDVEEIATFGTLEVLVLRKHMRIEGVEVIDAGGAREIGGIVPYQDKRYYTTLQAKTKTLQGVDIRTFKDELTRILIDFDVLRNNTEIRLSQFGQRMPVNVEIDIIGTVGNKKVIFVLDNNIKVAPKAPLVGYSGICWDIREYTTNDLIESMYKVLLSHEYTSVDSWPDFIIDNPERVRIWKFAYMLNSPVDYPKVYRKVLIDSPDSDDIAKSVGEVFISEFESIANMDINLDYISERYRNSIVSLVSSHVSGAWSDKRYRNFETYRGSFLSIFNILRHEKEQQFYQLRRFENYVRYFKVQPDIQELYMNFCNRVISVTVAWCKSFNVSL